GPRCLRGVRSMRMPSRVVPVPAVAAWLALAGLVAAPRAGQAAAPLEKSLPATTLRFAQVGSLGKLPGAFAKSQFGQLLPDPAMKPIKQDFAAKLEDASQQMKQTLGVTLDELLDLPRGAASIAVVPRDVADVPIAFLISADAADNAQAM